MTLLLAVLLSTRSFADETLARTCAELRAGQYVVLTLATWSAAKTNLATSRGRVRIDQNLLDVLEQVCAPGTVLKDLNSLICVVRDNEAGGACALRPGPGVPARPPLFF